MSQWIPRIRYNDTITTPPAAFSSAVGAGTGGTMPAGTYFYRLAAINANGVSLPGPETAPIVLSGTTSKVTLTWAAVPGATGYRLWRGTTAGSENAYRDVGNVLTYADTALAGTTAGTMPTVAPMLSWLASMPSKLWEQSTKKTGGADESASGVIASYRIRQDRRATVTVRFDDSEFDAAMNALEFIQEGAPFYFAFDVTRAPTYEFLVRQEVPGMDEEITPVRDDQYVTAWSHTIRFRTVDGSRIAVPFLG